MSHRIVLFNLPAPAVPDEPGQMTYVELDPAELAERHPALAEQLKGRRIVSHSVHTWGVPMNTTVSFVTEKLQPKTLPGGVKSNFA